LTYSPKNSDFVPAHYLPTYCYIFARGHRTRLSCPSSLEKGLKYTAELFKTDASGRFETDSNYLNARAPLEWRERYQKQSSSPLNSSVYSSGILSYSVASSASPTRPPPPPSPISQYPTSYSSRPVASSQIDKITLPPISSTPKQQQRVTSDASVIGDQEYSCDPYYSYWNEWIEAGRPGLIDSLKKELGGLFFL
jgi:hypothetical protein